MSIDYLYQATGADEYSQGGVAGSAFVSITLPETPTEGTFLFAHINSRGNENLTLTPPTGWTLQKTLTTESSRRIFVYYKVVGGGESTNQGTWELYSDATQNDFGAAYLKVAVTAYSGVNTSINVTGNLQTNGGPTVILPSVDITSDGAMLVAFFGNKVANGEFTTPTGMTERYDLTNAEMSIGSSQTFAQFDMSVNSGATGDVSSDYSGSSDTSNVGVLIGLTPSASVSNIESISNIISLTI